MLGNGEKKVKNLFWKGVPMLISEAMKRITTGIVYRTRIDGDQVKVIFKDGKVARILINDVVIDRGEGVEAENSLGAEDLFSDDWDVAQGY